jgi:hypothetical protein
LVFYILRAIWRSMTLTLFLLGLALTPHAIEAARVLEHVGEGAVAEYRLRMIPAAQYNAEIAAALDAGDGDMARSLVTLAGEQKIVVAPELLARTAALPGVDLGNVLMQGWNCVANGDFDSEAGFACVVATDLTGIGDARDLIGEGGNYLSGRPVNYLTLGIASAGLALTAGTVASLGAAMPVRAGVSFIKSMNKVGRLPPKLVGEVGLALSRSVDKAALAETVNLAREFHIGEMGGPLSRVFRPRGIAVVSDLATDFGAIGKAGGVRAMKLSAETAQDLREVKIAARTAEKYKGGYLGAMKLIGRGALRLGDLLLTFIGWFIAAALWIVGIGMFLMKTARRVARLLYAMLRWSVRTLWRVLPVPAWATAT